MIKLNGKEVKIDKFPDGTLLLKPEISVVYNFSFTITWNFENNEEMATLLFLTKHLNANGHRNIRLVMPYIPNARQDRAKDKMADVFTLKYFADFINFLDFSEVVVLDPHSSVSEALINNIKVVEPQEFIAKATDKVCSLTKNDRPFTVFYPDEGAMKRYSGKFNHPYSFGIKKRDWQTGKILGLDVIGDEDNIKGRNILIIDDICSKGGTFYHSAKKLKELGANKIFLYVTHCEKTILQGEIFTSGLIEKVFTTDSIFTDECLKAAKSAGVSDKIEIFHYVDIDTGNWWMMGGTRVTVENKNGGIF